MNPNDIRSLLEAAVAKKKKAQSDLDFKSVADTVAREIAGSISPDSVSDAVVGRLEKALLPVLERLLEKDRITTQDITGAISQMELRMPEIPAPVIPEIRVPQPRVTVNIPKINIPDIIMPEELQTRGWLGIMGYDKSLLGNPIPVQIRDSQGNPVTLGGAVNVNGGGGKADFFTIKGFSQSAYSEFTNPDGRLRVSVETGGSGLTDAELRASSIPVDQVSGASWSTYITGANGTIGVVTIDPDGNPVYDSATSGLTDTQLRASSVPVEQVSGSSWSTYVTGIFNSTTADVINADNRLRVSVETGGSGLTDSELRASAVPVSQVSGTSWSTEATQSGTWNIGTVTTVTGVTNSIAAALTDSSGLQYSGSNPLPVTAVVTGTIGSTGAYLLNGDGTYRASIPVEGTVTVSGVTASVAAALIDSSGVQYSTTNPVPIGDAGGSITIDGTVAVSGITGSLVVVGDIVSDAADNGSAPQKIGGVARTANPTAVANGDRVSSSYDDLGRTLVRPVQVRDLICTAYVSVSNGTETTLISAVAGSFLDLIYIMGANASDAAVTASIRAVSTGNIVMTLQLPANGTAGIACPIPLPQDATGNAWTVDLPDITGTTAYFTALFSKEV